MPAVLLVIRLVTGIGAIFKLGLSGARWARRRGKKRVPGIKPRFDWRLGDGDEAAPALRFRIKNEAARSAIIDEVAFSIRGKGGDVAVIPLPAGFGDNYPIQVKHDESSRWYTLALSADHVALLAERTRLASVRERGGSADPLASGVEMLVIDESGRHRFKVPGPWEEAPPATELVTGSVMADVTDEAVEVLDDTGDEGYGLA